MSLLAIACLLLNDCKSAMNNHINVVKSLTFLCFVSHGLYYITRDIYSNATLSVCIILLIVVLIYFTRIPAPPKEHIEQILGKDCHEAGEHDRGVTMRSVGHRGVSLDAPENSLEGFKLCLEHGMKFIEFDVTLTKDAVPIVFHDASLERFSDVSLAVKDVTFDALMDIDIGKKHAYGYKYKNIRIPTLDATVNQLLNDGQTMFIDLKSYNYKIVDIIIKVFQDFPELHSRAVVTSFSPILIYQIRKRNAKIACCLAWRPDVLQLIANPLDYIFPGKICKQFFAKILENIYLWALGSFIYHLVGISAILIRKDALSDVIIREWQQRNVRVIAWVVNSPLEKQYFARVLRIPYMTGTLTAENSTHSFQGT